MKIKFAFLSFATASVLAASCATSADTAAKQTEKERSVGVQMYTFHKFTFEDSIPKLKAVGISKVGLTRAQKLSSKTPKNISPELDAKERAELKKLISDNSLEIVSYGVITPKNAEEIEKLCKFAKEIGIPIILTESPKELLPEWERMCEAYGIKMCLHNHASDSKSNNYYKPEVVRDLIKPYRNIFACPDNGHWSRSGIDSVEGYKILEGKIAIVHFKDQKAFNDLKSRCVPFGEGVLDMKAMLAELDRQKFDGCFLIEYEANYQNNSAEVKKCADFLKRN